MSDDAGIRHRTSDIRQSSVSSANPPQGPAQHEHAARFFDEVSGTYRDKYTARSPFHQYFFNERLEKATRGLDLSDSVVLDIGGGTGDLYAYLVQRFPQMRFHATDVSAGMLAQSPVPAERKFVGHAYDHTFATRSFDVIFMLGVTTYLAPEELEKNLAFMAASLKAWRACGDHLHQQARVGHLDAGPGARPDALVRQQGQGAGERTSVVHVFQP